MKYGELNGLVEALKALRTQPQSFFVARKLKDVCDAVDKESAWYMEQLNDILNKCGEKDEQGELVKTEDGNGIQIRDIPLFKKLTSELMNTETGEIPTVPEDVIQKFIVSAEQLDYLYLICEDPENE